MTQPATDPDPNTDIATDCTFGTITGFLLPFFLAAAGGNPDIARAAIQELIDACNASTATELDLAGRIIGFSIAAMDNLRLSMTPGMSDTKVLRYRCNAVTLSRASDQARNILEAVQAKRQQARKTPRPSVAAAPPASVRPAAAPKIEPPAKSPLSLPPSGAAASLNGGVPEVPPMDIETMKRDARVMMQAFSKEGQRPVLPHIPDPAVAVAVRAAVPEAAASAKRSAA